MIDSDKFSKRLKLIMETHTISATQFAEILNVQRSSISHLLSGRNKPSLEFVLKVLKNFSDVELYWLLNGDGEYPKQKENIPQDSATLLKSSKPQKNEDTINEESLQINKLNVSNVGEEIERIIIFFKNGSFKSYSS